MTQPLKLLHVRGDLLAPWLMAAFFPLEETGFRQACILRRNNRFPIPDDFPLQLVRLRGGPRLGDVASGLWLKNLLVSRSFDREYCYGLEPHLAGFDVVRSADISYPFTWQCVRAHNKGRAPPVAVTVHENIPHIWGYKAKAQPCIEEVRRGAALFIALTHYSAQLCRQEGIEEKRIRVAGLAVDPARFRPGEADVSLRGELAADPEGFVVLALGRLTWEKGQQDLVHAVRALRLKGERVSAALVGSGSGEKELRRLIGLYGLGDSVRLVGPVPYERVPALLHSADCLVQPSLPIPRWQEQFGMAALEAMACGVPVITTPTGGIPEVVADAGLYFTAGNYVELAERVHRLAAEPGLRRDLAERGRERARLFS
ncbi:MAG TPA: glycosyltransferase family 1 protein, partial [Candidatus Coatesbacteria bacterium]|nr:glycosyltransferase family 1 protein [Candidatus Coatesbacteria bacterium]